MPEPASVWYPMVFAGHSSRDGLLSRKNNGEEGCEALSRTYLGSKTFLLDRRDAVSLL